MPSAGHTAVADDFWLTAHDGVGNARVIGDRPLGIGLATGLLAELVHGGWCQLWEGRLFRRNVAASEDPVLLELLDQMKVDEKEWPACWPSPAPLSRPPAPPTQPSGPYVGVHAMPSSGRVGPPVPEEVRPAGLGHDLREYVSWLAYEDRAAGLVGDRLARIGVVWREERRRMLGGTTVRYKPRNTVVTANPASRISSAVQRGLALSWSEMFLAGLYVSTGLDQHALFDLTPGDYSALGVLLEGLDEKSWELLKAADAAVGDAVAIR